MADDFSWNGKPLAQMTREELLFAARNLAAECLDLRRGYTHGGARPPHTKPKEPDELAYGRAPL